VRRTFMMSASLAAAAVISVGCGSSTAPATTGLTAQEQTALINAITSSQALTTTGAAFAPFIVQTIGATGTLNASGAPSVVAKGLSADASGIDASSYDAVGVQVVFSLTITGLGTQTGAYTGVVGWAGFNASTSTIDELVSAGAITTGGQTAPGAGTDPIVPPGADTAAGQTYGQGAYWNRTTGGANGTSYFGTDGTFALTSATFGGSTTNCPPVSTGGQGTVTCSYTTGSMGGNFNFNAMSATGSPYTQPNTTFSNLPAVQLNITLTQ